LEVTVMAQSSAIPQPESRYTRVKSILADAAGENTSNYGGLGAFWELPLDQLIEAKVFGVRLIAPAIQMVVLRRRRQSQRRFRSRPCASRRADNQTGVSGSR
jgi:hypothetical protein